MFERYEVENFYITNPGRLPLYTQGYTTGVVCDSGDNTTQTTCVFDDYYITKASMKNFNAGKSINDLIIKYHGEEINQLDYHASFS
jgi:actin-related protein